VAEYTEALFELTGREERSPEDEEASELLTVLIDRYESEKYPVPEAKPAEVLRFMLDQNGLSSGILRER
jgi:HTH-type transcriptional regulator/antitoxin HigA